MAPPKAVHDCLCPVRHATLPPNVLNTDPYVFGDHFKHICCGIYRRKYQPGDVILFGNIEKDTTNFLLDTVLVIKDEVPVDHSLNTTQYYKASIEPMHYKAESFYRGEMYASGKDYFSYVPCLTDYAVKKPPMPVVNVHALGFKVSKRWNSHTAKPIEFTQESWEKIMCDVTNSGWLIGTHIDKI